MKSGYSLSAYSKKSGIRMLGVVILGLALLLPSLSLFALTVAAQNPTVTATAKPRSTPTPKTSSSTPSLTTTISLTKTPVPLPPPRAFSRPPTSGAVAALAVDADTGKILYAKNPFTQLPQASTTKIMTALTLFSIPALNLNDYTTVVKDDLVGEANMGLYVGLRLKVVDLLYGLLLDSANDAAMALARYGGAFLPGYGDPVTRFVAEMNHQAQKLNLWNTHFKNPHGLDEGGHYSSAQDLAVTGWYALRNPVIAAIVRQNYVQLDGFGFGNISNFIRHYPGATGIKPGETDHAGLCLVAAASRYGHNAIIVLLNSPDLQADSDLLMDYALGQMVATEQNQKWNGINNSYIGVTSTYIGLPTNYNQLQPTLTNTAHAVVHGFLAAARSVLVFQYP